jgi:hypothetical protein
VPARRGHRQLLATAAAAVAAEPEPGLTEGEMSQLLGLADLVTRARTPVERDYQGNPAFAHALEMPTRFAKQLVQLAPAGCCWAWTGRQP